MLVSAVMITTPARAKLRKMAEACFYSQTYPEKELIVFFDAVKTVGEKRNQANTLARGEIIIHWDDDDWSAPERIQRQVNFLMKQPVTQVVGYNYLLYWHATGWGLLYKGQGSRIPGTTLCYRRDWWYNNPFRGVNVGEDYYFCQNADKKGVFKAMPGHSAVVARRHDKNTSVPDFSGNFFRSAGRGEFPVEFLRAVERG